MSGYSTAAALGSWGYDVFTSPYPYNEEKNYMPGPMKQRPRTMKQRIQAKRNTLNRNIPNNINNINNIDNTNSNNTGKSNNTNKSNNMTPCDCPDCAPNLYNTQSDNNCGCSKNKGLFSQMTQQDFIIIFIIIVIGAILYSMYCMMCRMDKIMMVLNPMPVSFTSAANISQQASIPRAMDQTDK